MELIVNGNVLAESVTDELISRSIHSLTGEGDSFAILAKAPQVYMQTSGGPNHGFVLEYRDGSEGEHYSCSDSELTADDVTRAFQNYLANDDQWKTNLGWEPHVFDYSQGSSGSTGSSTVYVTIGVAIIVFAVWKFVFAA